jgi:hypothetical protein
MQLKNKDIIIISRTLNPLPLDMKQSSARRRFMRILKPFLEDIDLEGDELKKKFAEKEADGSIKSIAGKIQYTPANRKLVDVEFEKLESLEINVDFAGHEEDKKVCLDIIDAEIKRIEDATGGKVSSEIFDQLEIMKESLAPFRG